MTRVCRIVRYYNLQIFSLKKNQQEIMKRPEVFLHTCNLL